MIAALLCTLALLDGALCAFRASAGRSGKIDKRAYYAAAVLRGLSWTALSLLGVWAAAGVMLLLVPDAGDTWRAWQRAGARALWVYGPYATLVLAALSLWAVPRPTTRILATVMVLGPFTLVRPLVVLAGLIAGVAAQPRPDVIAVALVLGVVMLGLEPLLGRRYAGETAAFVQGARRDP